MNSELSLRQLAGLRVLIGLGALVAPGLAGRLFGLDVKGNPQSPYLARLFGARDIALGVGALASSGEERRRWVQIGIAVDAADAVSAVLAGRDGSVSTGTAVKLAAPAVAAVALGAIAHGSGDGGAPAPA